MNIFRRLLLQIAPDEGSSCECPKQEKRLELCLVTALQVGDVVLEE